MNSLHLQARTSPLIRAEIAASTDSLKTLAKRYHLSLATVRKWKRRETFEDHSHCPHHLCTTLTPTQEYLEIELRKTLLLPLDDLLLVVRCQAPCDHIPF